MKRHKYKFFKRNKDLLIYWLKRLRPQINKPVMPKTGQEKLEQDMASAERFERAMQEKYYE